VKADVSDWPSAVTGHKLTPGMTLRTRRHSVTFLLPFSIPGLDGVQPPGTYTIETDEELLEQLSFTAYHRVSTSIVLPLRSGGGGSYEMVKIDPAELEAALRHDAENAAAKHGDLASGGDTGS